MIFKLPHGHIDPALVSTARPCFQNPDRGTPRRAPFPRFHWTACLVPFGDATESAAKLAKSKPFPMSTCHFQYTCCIDGSSSLPNFTALPSKLTPGRAWPLPARPAAGMLLGDATKSAATLAKSKPFQLSSCHFQHTCCIYGSSSLPNFTALPLKLTPGRACPLPARAAAGARPAALGCCCGTVPRLRQSSPSPNPARYRLVIFTLSHGHIDPALIATALPCLQSPRRGTRRCASPLGSTARACLVPLRERYQVRGKARQDETLPDMDL